MTLRVVGVAYIIVLATVSCGDSRATNRADAGIMMEGGAPPHGLRLDLERIAWADGATLSVSVRVANGASADPAPLAPAYFALALTGGAEITAQPSERGSNPCRADLAVAGGGSVTCQLVFTSVSGAPEVVYFRPPERSATAPVQVCSSAALAGLCPWGEFCESGSCVMACSGAFPGGPCAVVGELCERGVCRPRCSAVAPTGACTAGEMCRDGACVWVGEDGDGDGIPAATDCDDTDPSIGSTAELPCATPCGAGRTECLEGEWSECSAPSVCDCEEAAAARTIDCGNCGTQRQVCTGGMWVNDGACTGAGTCMPGQMETGAGCGNCGAEQRTCRADCTWDGWTCTGEGECASGASESESRACGTCGTGTQSRTRTCTSSCTWGAWGTFGTCSDSGECTPGATESESRACGHCSLGTQSRMRTCTSSCTWGAWSAYGTCSGGGACSPGATRYGCDRNSAGTATMCGVETCTSSCTWGSCQLAPGAQCMSGMGTYYQCCTPSGGGPGWQFCLSSTCTWGACASHSC